MKRCKYKRIKSNGRKKLNFFSFFIRKNCHFGKFRHVSEEILSRVRGNSIRCQKKFYQVSDSDRTGVKKTDSIFFLVTSKSRKAACPAEICLASH